MSLSKLETELVRLSLPVMDAEDVGLSASEVVTITELAARHSVLPIVVNRIGQPGPDLLVSNAAFTMLLRLRLEEIARSFQKRGLPFVVLKGAEFADRLYPEPAMRGFTDIDLMVSRDVLPKIAEVLKSLGYEPYVPEGLNHSAPYGEEVWRSSGPVKFSVEIHWNLVNSPPVQRGVSVLFEDLQRDTYGRLTDSAMLLIAAVHGAVSHQFDRLGLLLDVRQAAIAAAETADETYLIETAARTGARLSLVTALALAYRLWGDAECARFLKLFPRLMIDRVAQGLISPGLVLRPATRISDLRRRLFRELLKHRSQGATSPQSQITGHGVPPII